MNGNRRNFYRQTLMIAVPIMIQNGITNFVSMIDNIMVGKIGTDPMSGVAIVNQLIFVWNLCIFGGFSGIGIFAAQYYGKGDEEGIRNTFRLQTILGLILTAAGVLIFRAGGAGLIRLYLHEDGGVGNAAATLEAASRYLAVMLFGFLPYAFTQSYSTTLRSSGETVVPMKGSLIAVGVNLAGNYILIFGKFGAPALGVVGAACATVLSRTAEALYVIIWTHTHPENQPFVRGACRTLRVPSELVRSCIRKGTPLLVNETMWSGGMAVLTHLYSVRGLSVVAAFNISQTISNVFNVTFIAMGSAIGIILGQELGQGKTDEVKSDANRLAVFSVLICLIMGAGLFAVSGVFPRIYNTSDEIRSLAAGLIRISAVCMPIYAYANASYFTLRSGGKTFVTFLFDSCFSWTVSIPAAWALVHLTAMPILTLYLTVQLLDLLKDLIGYVLVQKGIWIQDITNIA